MVKALQSCTEKRFLQDFYFTRETKVPPPNPKPSDPHPRQTAMSFCSTIFKTRNVIYVIVCTVICRGFIYLQRETSTHYEEFDDKTEKFEYSFYGDVIQPSDFPEKEVKRDILSKLPKHLRKEIQKTLIKTDLIHNLHHSVRDTACPYQGTVYHYSRKA